MIWIPLEGLQTMSGHDPRLANDVSAVLIQLRAPSAGFMFDLMFNRQGNRLTFAYPVGAIIADFFSRSTGLTGSWPWSPIWWHSSRRRAFLRESLPR